MLVGEMKIYIFITWQVTLSSTCVATGGPVSNFMGVSILTLLHDDMKSQVRDVMADPERMEIQKVIGKGIRSGTT